MRRTSRSPRWRTTRTPATRPNNKRRRWPRSTSSRPKVGFVQTALSHLKLPIPCADPLHPSRHDSQLERGEAPGDRTVTAKLQDPPPLRPARARGAPVPHREPNPSRSAKNSSAKAKLISPVRPDPFLVPGVPRAHRAGPLRVQRHVRVPHIRQGAHQAAAREDSGVTPALPSGHRAQPSQRIKPETSGTVPVPPR